MKPTIMAYCWSSGLIEFGEILPAGALPIIVIRHPDVRDVVEVLARLSYDGKLLVPGIPEARTPDEALNALVDFCHRVRQRCLHYFICKTTGEKKDE